MAPFTNDPELPRLIKSIKIMAKEIEHKYLVSNDSYKKMASSVKKIRQGYLSRDPERVVRVRTVDDAAFLTVKGINHGDTRLEFEYEIPYSDALEMLSMCEGRVIEKKRYLVEYCGNLWEVDEFGGELSPLATAEIELSSSDQTYELPEFAGENVTGNPAYYNSALS